MEKIVRFDVAVGKEIKGLVDKVNKAIDDGWQPFGNIQIHVVKSKTPYETIFLQPIVLMGE